MFAKGAWMPVVVESVVESVELRADVQGGKKLVVEPDGFFTDGVRFTFVGDCGGSYAFVVTAEDAAGFADAVARLADQVEHGA